MTYECRVVGMWWPGVGCSPLCFPQCRHPLTESISSKWLIAARPVSGQKQWPLA